MHSPQQRLLEQVDLRELYMGWRLFFFVFRVFCVLAVFMGGLCAWVFCCTSVSLDNPPSGDTSLQSGRRQWIARCPDRPLDWTGPRRWRVGSWPLENAAQLAPILGIRDAVEKAVVALDEAGQSTNNLLASSQVEGAQEILQAQPTPQAGPKPKSQPWSQQQNRTF